MKITTKTDYAVILLTELSMHKEHAVSLQAIADKTGISEAYMQRIAAKLKKLKIIKPKHGAFGGYLLNKKPSDISLLSVVNAVGDDLFTVKCLKEGIKCPYQEKCANNKGWHTFQTKLNDLYQNTSIADLSI